MRWKLRPHRSSPSALVAWRNSRSGGPSKLDPRSSRSALRFVSEKGTAAILQTPRSGAHAVVEMNEAAREAALVEQLELRAHVVGHGALAASHHDRAQEQMALVDQPGADRLAGELGTPDRDVGLRGLLELPDGVRLELALDPRPRAGG